MLGTVYTATQHNIPDGFILQLQRLFYAKLYNSTLMVGELEIILKQAVMRVLR
jgi:hypothetical protein